MNIPMNANHTKHIAATDESKRKRVFEVRTLTSVANDVSYFVNEVSFGIVVYGSFAHLLKRSNGTGEEEKK